mmetsp:Transcript_70896/g.207728  ORF Transcript_70896/g.207728 Transcript_70896/m.207728 type:complete len:86 (+) Transcript_70896:102-359(+)
MTPPPTTTTLACEGSCEEGAEGASCPAAAAKCSSMPSGPGGQTVALEEEDVFPAEMSQVVRDRGADDAAPDDHDPRLRGQLRGGS